MLTRLTRVQLVIFGLVTVVAVGLISTMFLHVPAALGLGSYKVTAEFIAGGGLYKNANVTYRGVTVGRVTDVDLTDNGVAAHMRLNSNVKIPSNVTATVKSVSAIGEQYVDLVPPEQPTSAVLGNGARIDRQRTFIGQDVATLLRDADKLVSTIADTRLQQLLREAFHAFNGSGPELARLVGSARLLVDEANADWPQTDRLIDQAGPLLDALITSSDDVKSLAGGLAKFSTELRTADPQVRALLATAPSAADEATTTFSGIRPSFPVLAANLANLGRVGAIYHKSLEQLLVLFPPMFTSIITVAGGVPLDEGGKLDFKVDLGDPAPCLTGFVPAQLIRTPADETLRELPTDMYCKVAPNDPSAVRGARNYPCQEYPGKRAPTVQLCRDPRGYVPIGSNPWRGPPIPFGTPPSDPRSTFPANKFPYIPPQNDPDPGPPLEGPLPPGVLPGPGPAPHQPWPVQAPPPYGPPPPPLTWQPPQPYPQQGEPIFTEPPWMPGPYPPVVPQPGPAPVPPPPPPNPNTPPQASGPRYGTYDQSTGTFVDPAGGVGVYAPGDPGHLPAENWVDLMLQPRQA